MFPTCIDTSSAVETGQYYKNIPDSYGTFSLEID